MSNIALDSMKSGLKTANAVQNSYSAGAFDATNTYVSLFGYEIRDEIRFLSNRCNVKSTDLGSMDYKEEKDLVLEMSGQTKAHLNELKDTIQWSTKVRTDLLALPGISSAAISELNNTINQTISYGQEVFSEVIDNVNEAIVEVNQTAQDIPATTSQAAVTEQPTIETIETVNEQPIIEQPIIEEPIIEQAEVAEVATEESVENTAATTTETAEEPAITSKTPQAATAITTETASYQKNLEQLKGTEETVTATTPEITTPTVAETVATTAPVVAGTTDNPFAATNI